MKSRRSRAAAEIAARADAIVLVVMTAAAIGLYALDPLASFAWVSSSAIMTWYHRR